jgi:hypothetical protein
MKPAGRLKAATRIPVSWRRLRLALVCLAAILAPLTGDGRSSESAPPLPPPTGTVVQVSSEPQLQAAVRAIASNTTILIAPGTYRLTRSLAMSGPLANVAIRGATRNRDEVTLVGPGMMSGSDVRFGVWTGAGVTGITIANLTIRDVPRHAIVFNPGTQRPHVYNVRLVDSGDQFIKSNPEAYGRGVNNGRVEYSVFEYSTAAPDAYTNGVDVHAGRGWIIRHNLFRNIVASDGLAGPAILMWNGAGDTLVEGNTFLNCARGISFGLISDRGVDHAGGIIRNNLIHRSASEPGDVGIMVAASPGTQVLNNTVFVSGTYATPIEYRFAATTGVVLANNLLDGTIGVREGATGTVRNNLTGATAGLFVAAARGNLRLAPTASAAIDRGVTMKEVVDDFDGQPRPSGAAYDIGADEFTP